MTLKKSSTQPAQQTEITTHKRLIAEKSEVLIQITKTRVINSRISSEPNNQVLDSMIPLQFTIECHSRKLPIHRSALLQGDFGSMMNIINKTDKHICKTRYGFADGNIVVLRRT